MHAQNKVDAGSMTDQNVVSKLAELERVLNDPDIPFSPARVWALLAETTDALGLAGDESTPEG